MDYYELKKIVRKGEGFHTEFKLKANHPKKIVREAVAFANSEGGLLIIGVNDDKDIRGLKYAEEDEYVLCKALEENCSPHISYNVHHIQVENEREVLVFCIAKSDLVHYYIDEDENENQNRKVYIRVDDRSVKASREMREILRGKRRTRNVKFNYGDKERILMEYLDSHQRITVDEFSKTANIPRRVASRTLVLLVLANVLRVIPNAMNDSFEFHDQHLT